MNRTEPQLNQIPLTQLRGVGPALQKKLQQLSINNIQDLLFHLPVRYEDRTKINNIGSITVGETVQLQGEVVNSNIQFGRRRSLHCTLVDETGFISLRFFHFSAAQKNSLAPGTLIRCYGEVRRGRNGMEIYHPEYRLCKDQGDEPLNDSLTPIYPLTEGLQQARLRNIIQQALVYLGNEDENKLKLPEYLPQSLIDSMGLYELNDAIRLIHKPPIDAP